MEFKLPKISWRGSVPRDLISPERDWQVMCALATLALVAIFAIYFWTGRVVNHLEENRAENSTNDAPRTIRREEVARYATDLQARQAQFDLLIDGN